MHVNFISNWWKQQFSSILQRAYHSGNYISLFFLNLFVDWALWQIVFSKDGPKLSPIPYVLLKSFHSLIDIGFDSFPLESGQTCDLFVTNRMLYKWLCFWGKAVKGDVDSTFFLQTLAFGALQHHVRNTATMRPLCCEETQAS